MTEATPIRDYLTTTYLASVKIATGEFERKLTEAQAALAGDLLEAALRLEEGMERRNAVYLRGPAAQPQAAAPLIVDGGIAAARPDPNDTITVGEWKLLAESLAP